MWRVSFEFDSRDQFRQAWGYLLQECSVPEGWERNTPEEMRHPQWKWTNFLDSMDQLPDPLIFFNSACSPKVPGVISLYDFEHPEDATYIFGSDRANTYPKLFEGREYQSIFIPDTGPYYSFQAAAVVIYDRKFKQHAHNG